MGRNCISRHVQSAPAVRSFRLMADLSDSAKTVALSLDEFESNPTNRLRKSNQEAAAERYGSRPT